jgi:ABC-2 type transport system permease protein
MTASVHVLARGWWTLLRCEARMVARDTAGLVVPVVLPLLILVMNAGQRDDTAYADGHLVFDVVVVPIVVTIVLASIGVINVPSFLAYYRRSGILRRLAVTPVPPLAVLAAQLVVGVLQALVGIGVALAVALTAYDAAAPARPVVLAGVVVLTAVSLFACGMVVASLAPSPNAAVALGMVMFFALGALGGMFGSVDALPRPFAEVGERLPFASGVELMTAAWVGAPLPSGPVVALAVALIVGLGTAAATFRWDR